MTRSGVGIPSAALAALLTLAGCAPTSVQSTFQRSGEAPRPERILVYDFAVSPDEVQLDRGLAGDVTALVSKTPRTEEERRIGHAVARALSDELVKRIDAMGLPAQRAWGAPARWGSSVLIEGQFLSIDEGNQAERIVIGLGMGRTDVQTRVQVYETGREGLVRLEDFTTSAQSGYKPGMAETMGAGAAAGHLAVAAVVSTGATVASEALSASVQADAQRTAEDVAKQLQTYFAAQGWIPPQ